MAITFPSEEWVAAFKSEEGIGKPIFDPEETLKILKQAF
jgi:hypothetical protein